MWGTGGILVCRKSLCVWHSELQCPTESHCIQVRRSLEVGSLFLVSDKTRRLCTQTRTPLDDQIAMLHCIIVLCSFSCVWKKKRAASNRIAVFGSPPATNGGGGVPLFCQSDLWLGICFKSFVTLHGKFPHWCEHSWLYYGMAVTIECAQCSFFTSSVSLLSSILCVLLMVVTDYCWLTIINNFTVIITMVITFIISIMVITIIIIIR